MAVSEIKEARGKAVVVGHDYLPKGGREIDVLSSVSVLGDFKWPKGVYVGIDHLTGAVVTERATSDFTVVKEVSRDLETAIAHQGELFPQYSSEKGREPISVIIGRAKEFSSVFKKKAQINLGEIISFARFAGDYLESAGLLENPEEAKKKILEGMSNDYQEDFSLGVNTRASRVKIRGMLISFAEREVLKGLVNSEAASLEILLAIREFTRLRIEGAIEELLGIQKDLKKIPIDENEKTRMVEALKAVAGSYLAKVWVAPYLIPAREVAIRLVGCQPEKRKKNEVVLGVKKAEGLFKKKPVVSLFEAGKFTKAGEEMDNVLDLLKGTIRS